MGLFFVMATAILLTLTRSLAQKSEVTCPSSFDWARNDKGQDPCLVAALLQADCRNDTNVTVPRLAVNELYPGPDPVNTHDVCSCNSVVYSLLSACAACQRRFYVDWASWTTHCAIAYINRFPKNISSNIVIPYWAYSNITVVSAPSFDVDRAVKIALNDRTSSKGPTSSQIVPGGTVNHTGTKASTVWTRTSRGPFFTTTQPSSAPASTTNDPTPVDQTGIHKSLMIVGSVLGSVVAVAMASLVIWWLLRWTRRRVDKPLGEGAILYRPLVQVEIPHGPIDNKYQLPFAFSPLEMDITNRPSNTNDPFASHGHSRIDLPGYLFHTSPDSEHQQSPAVESSELFTTVGGHVSSVGHELGRRNSTQSSATSARINPFGHRRGASRGSTLLSSHQPSPARESPRAQGDSGSLA